MILWTRLSAAHTETLAQLILERQTTRERQNGNQANHKKIPYQKNKNKDWNETCTRKKNHREEKIEI